jgi:hypothetical protein
MISALIAGLAALWLPILVSAVVVFLASSVIHMGPLWHRGDYPQMPREAEVMAALRPLAIPPGDYFLPRAKDMKEYKTAEFTAKIAQGPVVVMTVMPNAPVAMGKSLAQWFVFLIVIGIFVALVTGHELPPGAPYLRVFKLAAVVAFMGYFLALCELSIWYRRSWGLTFKGALDGVIYGLLTGGVFGWLWPHLAH